MIATADHHWLSHHARDLLRSTLAVDAIADSLAHPEEFRPAHVVGDSVLNAYTRLLEHGWRVLPRPGLRVLTCAHYEALKDPNQRLPPEWLDESLRAVLVPACDDGHWRLLLVLPRRGRILVYDSWPEPSAALHPVVVRHLERQPPPRGPAWTVAAGPSPRQSPTDNDCALWVLYNLEALVGCGDDDWWWAGVDPPPPPPAPPSWMEGRRAALSRLFRLVGSDAEIAARRKRLPLRPIMLHAAD